MEKLKIAFVTGALGGIGTEICKKLSAQNYFIIATSRTHNPARFQNWCKDNNLNIDKFDFISVDLADNDSAKTIIESTIKKYEHVDVLVNAAGITKDSTFKKMTFEQWKSVIDTNLTSLYAIVHPVFLKMLEKNFGRIINISSINALSGQYGQTNYSATKAGIIGFTKSLAYEGAKFNITANSIAPGYTATPMVEAIPEKVLEKIKSGIPMRRLAKPSEIASAVMYLISEDAAYITGETISINGGQYLH